MEDFTDISYEQLSTYIHKASAKYALIRGPIFLVLAGSPSGVVWHGRFCVALRCAAKENEMKCK